MSKNQSFYDSYVGARQGNPSMYYSTTQLHYDTHADYALMSSSFNENQPYKERIGEPSPAQQRAEPCSYGNDAARPFTDLYIAGKIQFSRKGLSSVKEQTRISQLLDAANEEISAFESLNMSLKK